MQKKISLQTMPKAELLTLLRTSEVGSLEYEDIAKEFQRRKDLEPKPLTVLQQLTFITANDPGHEKYKIEEVFKSCFDKALSRLLPYTHFSNGCNYLLTKWKVDYCLPLAENAKNFEAYVTGTIGLSIEDFTLYYYNKSLFNYYYFRPNTDINKPGVFQAREREYSDLGKLVMYLVNGTFENRDTCKPVNDLMDSLKIGYNTSTYEYKYGNISVKRFMNGRIDLKGLAEAQTAIINKCLEIHEKIRRF